MKEGDQLLSKKGVEGGQDAGGGRLESGSSYILSLPHNHMILGRLEETVREGTKGPLEVARSRDMTAEHFSTTTSFRIGHIFRRRPIINNNSRYI
jgi:hypothetical protein